jgi:hypothetical protein
MSNHRDIVLKRLDTAKAEIEHALADLGRAKAAIGRLKRRKYMSSLEADEIDRQAKDIISAARRIREPAAILGAQP